MTTLAVALHEYTAPQPNSEASSDTSKLSLKVGDTIKVLRQEQSGWWYGVVQSRPNSRGWFPSAYVEIIEDGGPVSNSNINSNVNSQSTKIPVKMQIYHGESREPEYYPTNIPPAVQPNIFKLSSSNSSLNIGTNSHGISGEKKNAAEFDRPKSIDNLYDDDDYGDIVKLQKDIDRSRTADFDTVSHEGSRDDLRNIQSIPVGWHAAKTIDGKSYYYNEDTNVTVWDIKDIGVSVSASGKRKDSDQATSNVMFTEFTKSVYDSYILNIVKASVNLTDALGMKKKGKYQKLARKLIFAIQSLMLASDNSSYEKYPVETNNLLRAVSFLVLSVKTATSTWAPPDSVSKVKKDVVQVLHHVKDYLLAAIENGKSENVVLQKPLIDTSNNESKESPDENEVDFQEKIDTCAGNIKNAVDSFLQQALKITQNYTDVDLRISTYKLFVETANLITKHIGDTMNFLDEINFDRDLSVIISSSKDENNSIRVAVNEALKAVDLNFDSFERRFRAFQAAKIQISNIVGNLLNYAQIPYEDPLGNEIVLNEILNMISQLLRSTRAFMISIRKMSSLKEKIDQYQLLQQIQLLTKNSDDIVLNVDAPLPPPLISPVKHQQPQSSSNLKAERGQRLTSLLDFAKSSLDPSKSISLFKKQQPIGTNIIESKSNPYLSPIVEDAFEELKLNDTPPPPSLLKQRKTSEDTLSDLPKRTSRNHPELGLDINKAQKFLGVDANTLDSAQKVYSPRPFESAEPQDILFTIERNPKIRGGTFEALVERLTSHEVIEYDYLAAFLYTFRLFSEPEQLVEEVMKRYQIQPPASLTSIEKLKEWKETNNFPIKLRCIFVIKKWVGEYWFPDTDNVALKPIRVFIMHTVAPEFLKEAEKIISLLDKREEAMISKSKQFMSIATGHGVVSDFSKPAPTPKFPKSNFHLSAGGKSLLEFDPLEFARQLTLIDSEAFLDINPIEFLFYKPEDKHQKYAPNIRKMIKISNKITAFISEIILLEKDQKRRTSLLQYFIKVAERCHSLNNFASRHAVLSALNSSPVFRLKKTWEALPSKARNVYDMLSKLIDRDNNFMTYRMTLKTTMPPCIPFLGLYLTDLIFIKEGNPDRITIQNKSLINFDKFTKINTIIAEVVRFQSITYNLTPLHDIQREMEHLINNSRDMQGLHQLSLQIEPRDRYGSRTNMYAESNSPDRPGFAM